MLGLRSGIRPNRPRPRDGFTLVEVLIALLLLSSSLLTLQGAIRHHLRHRERLLQAESRYHTVLSLRDALAQEDLERCPAGEGTFGGIPYSYTAAVRHRSRTYAPPAPPDLFSDDPSLEPEGGEVGAFEVALWDIVITIQGRDFTFSTMHYKRVTPLPELF